MTNDDTATIEVLEQALADAHAELADVKADRDRLQKQLANVGDMLTETLVIEDADEDVTLDHAPLPSLDELMANLESFSEAVDTPTPSHTGTISDSSIEMLAPELVFGDEYAGGDASAAEEHRKAGPKSNSRLLVLADAKPPIKYPLYKKHTTIGRSTTADIRVNGDHVSRIHARIDLREDGVVIEDVTSKNGIKINAQPIKRHWLQHGDVLSVGRLHFTFIETS
jgi:FHA domain